MILSNHKKADPGSSPHLSFLPTPSQKTALTGSENGGYITGEEEEADTNHFTHFINELSG